MAVHEYQSILFLRVHCWCRLVLFQLLTWPVCMQEYYTSGFLSLQGAIDSYVLGTASSLETSLQTGLENVSIADSGVIIQRPSFWTEWGTVFPTAEYIHNEFYDGVRNRHPYLGKFKPHAEKQMLGLKSFCRSTFIPALTTRPLAKLTAPRFNHFCVVEYSTFARHWQVSHLPNAVLQRKVEMGDNLLAPSQIAEGERRPPEYLLKVHFPLVAVFCIPSLAC